MQVKKRKAEGVVEANGVRPLPMPHVPSPFYLLFKREQLEPILGAIISFLETPDALRFRTVNTSVHNAFVWGDLKAAIISTSGPALRGGSATTTTTTTEENGNRAIRGGAMLASMSHLRSLTITDPKGLPALARAIIDHKWGGQLTSLTIDFDYWWHKMSRDWMVQIRDEARSLTSALANGALDSLESLRVDGGQLFAVPAEEILQMFWSDEEDLPVVFKEATAAMVTLTRTLLSRQICPHLRKVLVPFMEPSALFPSLQDWPAGSVRALSIGMTTTNHGLAALVNLPACDGLESLHIKSSAIMSTDGKEFREEDITAVVNRSSSIQELSLGGDLQFPSSWVFPHLKKLSTEYVQDDVLEEVASQLEQGHLAGLRLLDLDGEAIDPDEEAIECLCHAIINGPPALRLQKFRLPGSPRDPALLSSLLRCPALSMVEDLNLLSIYDDNELEVLADVFEDGLFHDHLRVLRVSLERCCENDPSIRFFKALNSGTYSRLRVLEVIALYDEDSFVNLAKLFSPHLGIEVLNLSKIEVKGAEALCAALEENALPRLKVITTEHRRLNRQAVEPLIQCLRNQKACRVELQTNDHRFIYKKD